MEANALAFELKTDPHLRLAERPKNANSNEAHLLLRRHSSSFLPLSIAGTLAHGRNGRKQKSPCR